VPTQRLPERSSQIETTSLPTSGPPVRYAVMRIERLIASDPKRAISIFEESSNNYAIEAIGISCIANENFEGVAVIPVQSPPSSKP
jgi:hypothetical protein